MFQMVARHWELNFFFLTSPELNSKKAMFQGLACHFEIIFVFLTVPKCVLVEIEEELFQWLALYFLFILARMRRG